MTQVGQTSEPLTRHRSGEIVHAPPVSEEREHPKLGLALSGGGHRAAFFHIGVLAKLAELGLLRPVQVISTVSGGSIIGALYYLHARDAHVIQKPWLGNGDLGGDSCLAVFH